MKLPPTPSVRRSCKCRRRRCITYTTCAANTGGYNIYKWTGVSHLMKKQKPAQKVSRQEVLADCTVRGCAMLAVAMMAALLYTS